MRVVSGTQKGRKLKTIESDLTRPTSDRMKETIFNVIAFELSGCMFMDLFAGSGAIGIEALSRGAKSAYFIDNSDECVKVICENLENTGLINKAKIIKEDVFSALANIKGIQFDFIFLDPPYALGGYKEILTKLKHYNLIADDGKVIVEHSANEELDIPDEFNIIKQKKCAKTKVCFLSL